MLRKLVEPLFEKLDVGQIAGILILHALVITTLLGVVPLLGLVA